MSFVIVHTSGETVPRQFGGLDFSHLKALVVSAFRQLSLISLSLCFAELLKYSLSYGQHHGCGSRVTDPHGEEGCYTHEA